MFNKKSKSESKQIGNFSAPTGTSSHIVQGTVFDGNINCENDIRIDGLLTGKLECSGRVIIGASGHIKGDVNCQNALVEGKFEGNLVVNELLSIKESASISGEIDTGKLHIQQGAVFNVKCAMAGQEITSFGELDS